MGFFDNAVDKRMTKLIFKFTGVAITPKFHLPCTSSISIDWDGWCAIDDKSIWLVNKYGARGVEFGNIAPTNNWGQWPYGSRGFPKYRFEFHFLSADSSVTIYPKTAIGGAELNQRLSQIFRVNP